MFVVVCFVSGPPRDYEDSPGGQGSRSHLPYGEPDHQGSPRYDGPQMGGPLYDDSPRDIYDHDRSRGPYEPDQQGNMYEDNTTPPGQGRDFYNPDPGGAPPGGRNMYDDDDYIDRGLENTLGAPPQEGYDLDVLRRSPSIGSHGRGNVHWIMYVLIYKGSLCQGYGNVAF